MRNSATPQIRCTPQIKWTLDRKKDTILKEQRHCHQVCCGTWDPHGEWKLSDYEGVSCAVAERTQINRNTIGNTDVAHYNTNRTMICEIEGRGQPTIMMSSHTCGNWMEYSECWVCCHPQSEVKLCNIMNEFMMVDKAQRSVV